MEELVFPIERNSAMHWFAVLMTGAVAGKILVSGMLLIGLAFMWTQGFSFISIAFFIVFIAPMSVLIHKRLVKRGTLLMKDWCKLSVDKNSITFVSGYPNTMNPFVQEVKITEKNRDILIRGQLDTGYQLKLSGNVYPEIRFGLWFELDDAREAALKLSKIIKGKVIEETKDQKL